MLPVADLKARGRTVRAASTLNDHLEVVGHRILRVDGTGFLTGRSRLLPEPIIADPGPTSTATAESGTTESGVLVGAIIGAVRGRRGYLVTV
jgi:hypothetical protein